MITDDIAVLMARWITAKQDYDEAKKRIEEHEIVRGEAEKIIQQVENKVKEELGIEDTFRDESRYLMYEGKIYKVTRFGIYPLEVKEIK